MHVSPSDHVPLAQGPGHLRRTVPAGSITASGTVAKLVRVAHAEPLLRQLSPWTGMWELHFSRCTEMDYTWDIPYTGAGVAVPPGTGPCPDRRCRS
ncbi:DUF6193 family natural product biosynthesis protein [Streptomyces sp. DH8]|uniref:DUF6193 family natural product biosynthesis protein n=1 Tax=Streptomyces sp. DH8 TaxID=2857008 RepID=UPI0035AED23F